uniref:Uncharacterized protein n=1 Tax=Arundo donax TaxID=35708 RepID=A0A0A9EQ26_ARUDO
MYHIQLKKKIYALGKCGVAEVAVNAIFKL